MKVATIESKFDADGGTYGPNIERTSLSVIPSTLSEKGSIFQSTLTQF